MYYCFISATHNYPSYFILIDAQYEESMDKVVSGYQFYAKVSPIRRESSGASSASKVSQRQKDARQKDQQVLQTMLVTQEEEPTKVVLDQVRLGCS